MDDVLVIAALAIALILLSIIMHKIRRLHLQAYRIEDRLAAVIKDASRVSELKTEISNLYNQLQAYQDLVALVRPTKPLPLLRGWAASPDFLLEVCRYSLSVRPDVIVECSSGASTLVLARCCELNGSGHVYSLEHNPAYAEETRQRLQDQNLDEWATVVDAPLTELTELDGRPWYSLSNLHIEPGSCQLLVIDGPPSEIGPQARYPALPMLSSFLAEKCAIFLDDAKRHDEQLAIKRWLEQFREFQVESYQFEKGCTRLTRRHEN